MINGHFEQLIRDTVTLNGNYLWLEMRKARICQDDCTKVRWNGILFVCVTWSHQEMALLRSDRLGEIDEIVLSLSDAILRTWLFISNAPGSVVRPLSWPFWWWWWWWNPLPLTMSACVRKASPPRSFPLYTFSRWASLRLYSVRLAITADSCCCWSILARCCSVTSFSRARDARSLSSASWPLWVRAPGSSPIRRHSCPSTDGEMSIGSGAGGRLWPFW